jgi:hypothetical protein
MGRWTCTVPPSSSLQAQSFTWLKRTLIIQMFSPISFSSHYRDLTSLGSGIFGALRNTDRHKWTPHPGEGSFHVSFLLNLCYTVGALAMKSNNMVYAFPLSLRLRMISWEGLNRFSWHVMNYPELCRPSQLWLKSSTSNWHTVSRAIRSVTCYITVTFGTRHILYKRREISLSAVAAAGAWFRVL